MNLPFLIGHFKVVDHIHVLHDAHFLEGGGFAGGVVVIEGFRQGESHVVKGAQVLQIRHPAAVRSLVVQEQAEGLIGLPAIQPVQRHIGGDVGAVALAHHLFPVPDEDGVVIVALAGEDVPVVEARGIAHQVPFAHHGRLVAARLQQFGQGLLAAVEDAVFVVGEAVLVAVLAR